MNKYFREAQSEVMSAIEYLQRLLPEDGEDISCYTHRYIDDPMTNLANAKGLMVAGQMVDELTDPQPEE